MTAADWWTLLGDKQQPPDQTTLGAASDWFREEGEEDLAEALSWAARKGVYPNWALGGYWTWKYPRHLGGIEDSLGFWLRNGPYYEIATAWRALAYGLKAIRDYLT